MRKILTILLCVACLCANAQSGQTIISYIIAPSGANLRYQDSMTGEVIRVIPFGEQIKILGTANNIEWFKADYNGEKGFISKTVLGSADDVAQISMKNIPICNITIPVPTKTEILNNIDAFLFASEEDLRTNCLFGGGNVVIRYTNNTPYTLQSAMVYVTFWRSGKSMEMSKELIRFNNIPAYGSDTQTLTFERGCEVELTQGARECNGLGINTYGYFWSGGR